MRGWAARQYGSTAKQRRGRSRNADEDGFDHSYSSLFTGAAPTDGAAVGTCSTHDSLGNASSAAGRGRSRTTARTPLSFTPSSRSNRLVSSNRDSALLRVVPFELAGNVGRAAEGNRNKMHSSARGSGVEAVVGSGGAGAEKAVRELSVREKLEQERDRENVASAWNGGSVRGAIPAKPGPGRACNRSGKQYNDSSADFSAGTEMRKRRRPSAQTRRERKLRTLLGKAGNPFERQMDSIASNRSRSRNKCATAEQRCCA